MAFNELKKKLNNNDDDTFTQIPLDIPGTQGLDPNANPYHFLGQTLHKTIGVGHDVPTQDAIEPVASPIDAVAALAGSKLGTALAQNSAEILGNEVGAINFGKGIIDKTETAPPIGRVFREESVLPKPDYGKVILKPDNGPGFYPTKTFYPKLRSKLK
jgi:hypothetical protein